MALCDSDNGWSTLFPAPLGDGLSERVPVQVWALTSSRHESRALVL